MGKKKNRKKHKAPILSVPKPTQPKRFRRNQHSTQVMDNTRQSEQYGPSTEKRDSPRIEGKTHRRHNLFGHKTAKTEDGFGVDYLVAE